MKTSRSVIVESCLVLLSTSCIFLSDCLYLYILSMAVILAMNYTIELLLLTFILLIVYHFSSGHVFRYYMKNVIYVLTIALISIICIPLMLRRSRDSRNVFLPAWLTRKLSWLFGLKWKMRGIENIVQDSGCVMLINHQSYLDLLVLAEIYPVFRKFTVIAKKELFYIWPFGLAAWLCGIVFIDRLNVSEAKSAVNKTGEIIRTKQASVCFFPEGTRHGGKELLPFKKGAFHMAIAAQVPIQPIVVSRYHFLDSNQHKFDTGTNIIHILPPIPTKGLTKDDLGKLMNNTYTAMSSAYTVISEEVLSELNKKTTF